MDGASVLIVDDDPVNLDLLDQQLVGLGATILTAQDGNAALRQLRPDFPGIVVTDLKMPHVDGLELLRHSRERDPDLPVIIVTGHGDIAIAVQAIRDGAYDFIERPYDADRLREMAAKGESFPA